MNATETKIMKAFHAYMVETDDVVAAIQATAWDVRTEALRSGWTEAEARNAAAVAARLMVETATAFALSQKTEA